MEHNDLLKDMYIAATTVPFKEVFVFYGLVVASAFLLLGAAIWLSSPPSVRRSLDGYRGAGF